MDGLFWYVEYELPAGVGFALFGPKHLAALAAALGLIAALCRISRGADGRRFRRALALVILGSECFRTGMFFASGWWSVHCLPLHLCGLAVFFVLLHALTDSPLLGELLWCLCMPGAALALLFPDWTDYPLGNAMCLNAFFVHALLTAYPLICVLRGSIRPDARRLPCCFLFMAALIPVIWRLDCLWNANFFFLLEPPPGSPLVFFERLWGRPGYLLGFLPLAGAVWLLLYLPPALLRPRTGEGGIFWAQSARLFPDRSQLPATGAVECSQDSGAAVDADGFRPVIRERPRP